jgi:hypothetical protein
MAVILLFVLMLLVMLMRVFMPRGVKVRGKVVHKYTLSLVERFVLHRINLYSIGAVLFLMTITGTIPSMFQFLVLFVAQVILFIPARFIVTTEGVAFNNVVYRPWSEFSGYTLSTKRISLIGQEGTRPLNVPITANHQKEIVAALGRHLPEIKARKEAGARVTVG